MLRPKLGAFDFGSVISGLESDVAGFITAAMRDTVGDVTGAFRDQVRAAGLGDRLANAVRGVTYPRTRNALEPAGWVYAQPSKTGRGAAAIIDSYANGRTIVPRNGKRWLLIPTDDCPKHRQGDAFTLTECEAKFGKLEWIPADAKFSTPSARASGNFHIVTKRAVIRKATGRWRKASPRELAGNTRNPRPVQTVILFTAVRAVKKPQSIDMSVPEQIAATRFEANLNSRWR